MHYHSPLDFSLNVEPGVYRGSLAGASGLIAESVSKLGFASFERLARHVEALPLGHTRHPGDPLAVLSEGRGTSASKHRLLAMVAQGCGHYEVMLTLGLYAMDGTNTPGVGEVLAAASLASIPQTCCYLSIDHQRFDFSGGARGRSSPFASLSAEVFVPPEVLDERKEQWHREALSRWAPAQGLSEQAAWAIGQACAAASAGAAPAM